MPRQTLIATALLVGISMLAVARSSNSTAKTPRLLMSKLRSWLHQKTWTKVWYDYSARKAVSHTSAADIKSVADTPTGYTLKDIQAQLDVLAIVGAAAGG
jgi:hypothetical protein